MPNFIKLGFKTYKDYLSSNLWKKIRIKVFHAKGRKCAICQGLAEQIHHNRYEVCDLRGKLTHLHPLCGLCHAKISVDENGRQRTQEESVEYFNILCNKDYLLRDIEARNACIKFHKKGKKGKKPKDRSRMLTHVQEIEKKLVKQSIRRKKMEQVNKYLKTHL